MPAEDGERLLAQIFNGFFKEVFDGSVPIERAHLVLEDRRRSAFQAKWRFNRTMRSLVASPGSVTMAATTAKVLPALFARMIRYAGDCA